MEYKSVLYQELLPLEHVVLQEFDTFCGEVEDRGIVDYTPTKRFPCRQLQSLSIFWNGEVAMCKEDFNGKFLVGNLSNQSLKDIWHSEQLHSLRILHKEGRYTEHPLCSLCKEWYKPVN
jgi:radical SAM protein with 4Fe4S-binding SPASM domain